MTGGWNSRPQGRQRWIAAIVVALVLCGACSDGGGGTPEPRTLHVLMTDDWVTPPFLDAVRDFEAANEGVRVVVDKKSISTMLDDLASGNLGDSPPDVVQNHAFAAGARGLARPVDDLWKKHLRDDEYFPGALDDVMWAGRHYGVPLDTNALVMVYNADLLRAAGVTPPGGPSPMTFADFEALARAVTSPDGSRRAIGLGTSIFRTFGWVAAGGGSWLRLTPDGTPAFSVDSPETLEALAFMAGLVGQGLAFAPVPPGTGSASVYALFESGTTVFQATGSWDVARLRKSRPDVELGVLPMPRARVGPTSARRSAAAACSSPSSRSRRTWPSTSCSTSPGTTMRCAWPRRRDGCRCGRGSTPTPSSTIRSSRRCWPSCRWPAPTSWMPSPSC